MLKGLNKNVSKNEKQASIEIEISPKTEEKETTPTGLQSMHRQEAGKF